MRNQKVFQRTVYIVLFLLPAVALFGWFVVQPTVSVVLDSFTKWNGIPSVPREYIGAANYRDLLRDGLYWNAFLNTLEWLVIATLINVVLGFFIAYVMSQPLLPFRTGFQILHFLPSIQAGIVTAIVWRWALQPDGALNKVLGLVIRRTVSIGWLGDPLLVLPSLAVANSWGGIGLSIVLFLTGLQSIDPALYESAELDGASFWRKFLHITIPLMRATTTTVVILVVTGAFKAFDLVWATTQGGPFGRSEILGTYIYKTGFHSIQFGYGSAMAMVLAVVVFAFSAFYVRRQQAREA